MVVGRFVGNASVVSTVAWGGVASLPRLAYPNARERSVAETSAVALVVTARLVSAASMMAPVL